MIYGWMIIGTIINAYVALVSGISVMGKGNKDPIARRFAVFCAFMALWALCYFFPLVPNDYSLSLLSFQLLHVGAIFIAVAHLDFIVHFLHIEARYRYWVYGGYLFNLLILFFVPTNAFIADMEQKFGFGYWANPGPIYDSWLAVWLFYIGLSLYLLVRAERRATGLRRKQIRYLLLGDCITFLFGSTNFFMFYNINIWPYFNVFASGQILLFSYVIARYRFSNIRLNLLQFLRRTLSFLLAFVTIYVLYSYVNLFIDIPKSLTTDIILLVLALMLYHFFEALLSLKHMASLLRLSDYETFQHATADFTQHYGFDADLKALQQRLKETFVDHLKLASAELKIIQPKTVDKHLLARLQTADPGEVLVFSELLWEAQDKQKRWPFLKAMEKEGEVFLPVYNVEDRLIAYVALGAKRFANPYHTEEIDMLRSLGPYLSKSLAVINYHHDLSSQVAAQTKALRTQNKQLEESYQRLKELDNVKDEFLSIASHELRTPLTIIKGYTDFLSSEQFGTLNKKQKEFSEKILRNTNELISMINCMLDISRLESGRMEFNFEAIEIQAFLKNIEKEFALMYSDKSLNLSLLNPKKLQVKVWADPEKLGMVMTNLLGNAYKFTPEGGNIVMEIKPDRSRRFVQILVHDDGVGIPKQKQAFIFNKFQQADNPLQKAYAGSGLGLNIARQIIEKMGGKIWVKSEMKVKKGSVFGFTLPLASEHNKTT